MMVKKSDRKLQVDTPQVRIYDYALSDVTFGVSFQTYVAGRYPAEGSWRNTVCEEAFYVTKGSAVFFIGDEELEAAEGDIVVIPVGTNMAVDTHDGIEMLTITNPDWFESQAERVP